MATEVPIRLSSRYILYELAVSPSAATSGLSQLSVILSAVWFGLVTVDDVVRLMTNRPDDVEIILTGRYAPREFIELADLVSEMKEIKHYYRKGVTARDGIER